MLLRPLGVGGLVRAQGARLADRRGPEASAWAHFQMPAVS